MTARKNASAAITASSSLVSSRPCVISSIDWHAKLSHYVQDTKYSWVRVLADQHENARVRRGTCPSPTNAWHRPVNTGKVAEAEEAYWDTSGQVA